MSYDAAFYTNQRAGSIDSAREVVPLIIDTFRPGSVVDIGCGTGTWLSAFQAAGIGDVFGIDGAYVDTNSLMIERTLFQARDLTQPLTLERTFELACCLEVGEHIPTHLSGQLVDGLVALAPVVVFSAAIPGQCGVDHVNEQWQFFWYELFRKKGFVAVDCMRPRIFENKAVDWWYRQNMIIYCRPDKVPDNFSTVSRPYDINRILPEMTVGPKNGTQALEFLKLSIPLLAKGVSNKFTELVTRR